MSPAPGRIRIIGGRLRGSKLEVPALPGLRPTPDRLRETLFNWLMPTIEGVRCLDLFAGTGALGIEALSRGAREAVFVERDALLVSALRANLARLKVEGSVLHASANDWLRGPASSFGLVFMDPPFADRLWTQTLEALLSGHWLGANALIYMESPATEVPDSGASLQLIRSSTAGSVRAALYRLAPGLG